MSPEISHEISAENLSMIRGGRLIFSHINFHIQSGQMLQIMGPNGSGKSSLLRLLAGLGKKHQGMLVVKGPGQIDLSQISHYIADQPTIKLALSVTENLNFWCDLLEGDNIAKALAAFALEELSDYRALFLSQGQQRRLSLARLYVHYRPVWLLDEPFSALDQASCDRLAHLMAEHLAKGGIIVAATHVGLGIRADHCINLTRQGS